MYQLAAKTTALLSLAAKRAFVQWILAEA